MSGFLLVNPRSGSAEARGRGPLAAATRRGVRTHVLRPGDDAVELARAADASALGMAGGDGSLGAVARVAIERDLPFVCIPFGTTNHFSRDAGLDPDDPIAALAAFEGVERRIDVGRVGDRVVPEQRLGRRLRAPRAPARARAPAAGGARPAAGARLALRRPQPVRARLDERWQNVAVLLVANNAYSLDFVSVGERERLDEGLLHLYVNRAAPSLALGGAKRAAVRARARAREPAGRDRRRAGRADQPDRGADRAARATSARARPLAARPSRPDRAAGPRRRANQRSSATSSAACGSPPVTRTSQTRFSTWRAPGPSP